MSALAIQAIYRNRPPVRHHHLAVPVPWPERATWAKAGLRVLYEYCRICRCVPVTFMAEG